MPGQRKGTTLKNDFGMIHAPVQRFFGNWLYWQAAALAHNIGLWLHILALSRALRGHAVNGCIWHFSTSLPGWCVIVDACTYASPQPIPTSRRSPPRYDTSGSCRPSVDAREPAPHRISNPHRRGAISHA